jgi:hypothetical protein
VLGHFNFDILLISGHNFTARYFEFSFFFSSSPISLVVRRPASKTCINHVLTKFPRRVVAFGVRLSQAISDHCFLYF